MSCELADIVLEFPRTGIRVQPLKIDFRREGSQLAYASVTVSREAGELIGRTLGNDVNPVEVGSLGRMALEPDGVSIGADTASVRLRDPRVVLNTGFIEKRFNDARLMDVVSFIYEAADDPHGVLLPPRYADNTERNEITGEYAETVSEATPQISPTTLPSGSDTWLAQWFEKTLFGKREILVESAFYFDGVTPAQALAEVLAEFELASWCDLDGHLWIGVPQNKGKFVPVGSGQRDLKLVDYRMTENANVPNRVLGEGVYEDFIVKNGKRQKKKKSEFRARAEATVRGESVTRTKSIRGKKVRDYADLEAIVQNALIQGVFYSAAGDMEVLPLASHKPFAPAEAVDVGDTLYVPGRVDGCDKELTEGLYVVRSVRHELSAGVGWKTTFGVGRLLSTDEIDTRVFVTYPGLDEWVSVDDLEN